jgi:regulator of replication initiation timing
MDNTIRTNLNKISTVLQSFQIPANYELMAKFATCHRLLQSVAEEVDRLEAENDELKKALGMDQQETEEPEEPVGAVAQDEDDNG